MSMKNFCIAALCVPTLLVAGCQSIAVDPLPPTANASEEIEKLKRDRDDAVSRQVDVLSPTYFSKEEKWLADAIRRRDKGEDPLKQIATARAYLTKANETARVGETILSSTLQARRAAIQAGAMDHAKREFEKADEALRDATEDIEDNDIDDARKIAGKLESRYLDVELQAIRQKNLGHAYNQIDQALKEGAERYAPNTLESARNRYEEASQFIADNRHDVAQIEPRVAELNKAADHLVVVTREAKVENKKHPEEIALELEAQRRELERSEAEKKQLEDRVLSSQGEVQSRESAITQLEEERNRLEAERQLEEKYDAVRAMFTREEADVFREGNQLHIRLKGLQFRQGRAELVPSNFPLLAKVQNAVKTFAESKVTVEGHTDATGSATQNKQLSEQRAQAVREYLVANGALPQENVTAAGFGFEEPIASNKTEAGRKQNRRVDLVIEPTVPAARR